MNIRRAALVGLLAVASTRPVQAGGHIGGHVGGHIGAPPQGLGFSNNQNLGFTNTQGLGFSNTGLPPVRSGFNMAPGHHGLRGGSYRSGYYSPGYYGLGYLGGYGLYGGSGFYVTPGYYGNAPTYEAPYPVDFAQPNGAPPPAQWIPPARADIADVTVRVPPDAEVWIEGVKMKQQGSVRKFTTPQLDFGMTYSYDIRAAWKENGRDVTETRHVDVRAGDRLSLTFVTK